MARAAKAKKSDYFPGIDSAEVREWYRITHLGRLIETKRQLHPKSTGVDHHAPFES